MSFHDWFFIGLTIINLLTLVSIRSALKQRYQENQWRQVCRRQAHVAIYN